MPFKIMHCIVSIIHLTRAIYLGTWNDRQKQTINYFLENVGKSSWYQRMFNGETNVNQLSFGGETHLSPAETNQILSILKEKERLFMNYLVSGESWASVFNEVFNIDNIDKCVMGNSNFLGIKLPKKYCKSKYPSIQSAKIQSAIKAGKSGNSEENPIFFFLLGPDVHIPILNNEKYLKPTWYERYCGTHTFGNNYVQKKSRSTRNERFVVAYYPTQSNNLNCIPSKMTKSPNGDAGLDAILNVIAHEFVETVTGYDIANQCVYQFGNIKTDVNGGNYTEKIGDKRYFIQQNFNYKTQTCENGQ